MRAFFQVDVAVDERSGLLIRRHGVKFDIGLGLRRARTAKEPWNELEGGRVDETQTKTTTGTNPKLFSRPGNPPNRSCRAWGEGCAVGRRPHPPRGALEERKTEVGFELPDLLTECWLGNEGGGGPAEVQFLGHSGEGIEAP